MYKFYLKLNSIFLLICLLCILFSNKGLAFSDDFTSDPRLSTSSWEVQNSSGLIWTNPGIQMSSTNTSTFPYLRTKNAAILNTDKYYEMKFQFVGTGSPWGVGGSFTDNAPIFPTYLGTVSDYLSYNIAYFFGEKLHFVTALCPKDESICPYNWWFIYPNPVPSNSYYPLTNVDTLSHTFAVLRNDISPNIYSYKVFLDSKQIFESQSTSRIINGAWLGHPSDLSDPKNWPTIQIFSVKSLPDLPTTFPYLSQKDPKWASEEYDSATEWAGLEKSGIDRWGCALTSAAMILQENEVKALDGTAVDPSKLNIWLKGQSDGYIGSGLINWIAVTRYAKDSVALNSSGTKLEYVRSYLPTAPILPAILGLPGHFVVAHGEDATNWNINDPASETKKTLAKTSTIKSINRFVPSNTDLSYMMFVVKPGMTVMLKNNLGELVPVDWSDEYLTDDVDQTNGETLKVGMVAKPSNGKYILTANQTLGSSNEIKIFLYDKEATPTTVTKQLTDTVINWQIEYAKEPESPRSIAEVDLTAPATPEIVGPTATYVKPTGLILDWSDVTDPSMPVTYNYKSSWNGGTYGPVSTGTNSFIDASGTADNTYSWQVQACDNVGNCSPWSNPNTVTVDSVPPTADIVFPSPGPSSNYYEVVFSESVNPSEATNSANYYLSNWPGAGGSGDLVGDANITYNVLSKTARIIFTSPDWYISAEQLWGVQNIHDLAGNLLDVNPYTEYSTPMTAPVLKDAPVSTPNPTLSLSQTWSWLGATDEGSGVKGYSTRTYDAVAEKYLDDWLWMGQVLGTTTTLGEGKWKLSLKAADNAGNESESWDSAQLLVDRTPPSIPINLHFNNPDLECGGFTNSKTVTIDWDDSADNNKLAGYEYNVDYPLGDKRGSWTTFFTTSSYRGSLNEGIHYIKLRSKDSAGNYSAWSNSCAITYDSLNPTIKDRTTFSGWYRTTQTSYFDFADANLTTNYLAPSCEITIESETSTCTVAPNVCDKAGNCYKSILASYSAKIDLTKPLIEIRAWGSTINGVASDSLSGLDKIELRITKPDKSEMTVKASGTTNWSYTMSDAPYGDYKVVATAYDAAGNNGEANKDFVMSPPADNQQVLGATTNVEEMSNPLIEKEVMLVSDRIEVEESPLPPAMTPLPTPAGDVLGETVEEKANYSKYWWILGLIGVVVLTGIIYLAKKKWWSES